MRKFIALVATWLALCGSVVVAQQILPGFPPGAFSNKAALDPAPGSGGCSAATTFLARTSGLSGTETAAYTTMICGMITDGVGCSAWSGSSGNLDTLYIFATNTTTTAKLNLCSTSFSITTNGTLTFTADTGWAGDGSTGYLDTGYAPGTAGGNLTLNSASFGVYDRTASTPSSATQTQGAAAFGSGDGGLDLLTFYSANSNTYYQVNNIAGIYDNAAVLSNSQAFFIVTRTGASTTDLYLNGNTTPAIAGTAASSSLTNQTFFIDSFNQGGPQSFSTDQISAVFIGGGLTSTQMHLVATRINAYMTALGVNIY